MPHCGDAAAGKVSITICVFFKFYLPYHNSPLSIAAEIGQDVTIISLCRFAEFLDFFFLSAKWQVDKIKETCHLKTDIYLFSP